MRGIVCRALRLGLVAGLGIELGFALAAPARCAAEPQLLATQTTLAVDSRDLAGRMQATVSVRVIGADGLPASGAVVLTDCGKELAGVALNAEGKAATTLALTAGEHRLRAAYLGDSAHSASASPVAQATGQATSQTTGTPNFTVTAAPATLTLTAGQTGTLTASVIPTNQSALASPMFVSLSCSGLPDQASCSFTPATVEIQASTTANLTSTMVIVTQAASTTASKQSGPRSTPIAWAILLPGALGLGGLAWGLRRNRWLSRFMLLALVATVTVLGTTGCNPRYYYLNHGPIPNPATPAGTYTVTVTAQSNNGVTAITQNTTLALTVQ